MHAGWKLAAQIKDDAPNLPDICGIVAVELEVQHVPCLRFVDRVNPKPLTLWLVTVHEGMRRPSRLAPHRLLVKRQVNKWFRARRFAPLAEELEEETHLANPSVHVRARLFLGRFG
jgi:hypothetical protein